MIPANARARGIPTAQPTMTPTLELEPLLDPEPPSAVFAGLAAGGVMVTSTVAVCIPPVESEVILVFVDVKGFAEVVIESAVAVTALEPAVEEAAFEDAGADVLEPEPPPPEPPLVAMPVILARSGASDAVFEPTVAYAFPSCSAKNGRGSGKPWQQ